MDTGISHTFEGQDPAVDRLLEGVREKVKTCIGCGTCTASCPNGFAMDLSPRKLWRLLLLEETREVFQSRTFCLCSSCYCCMLRCPRGLPLTEVMADLKQIAAHRAEEGDRAGGVFHRLFVRAIRQNGRIPETQLMACYLTRMGLRHPTFPMAYASLGIRLMQHGKLSLRRTARGASLERIFQKMDALRWETQTGSQ